MHRIQHYLWFQESTIGLRMCRLWVGWRRLLQCTREWNKKEPSPGVSRTFDLRLIDRKPSQEENWVEVFQGEGSANTNTPGMGEYQHVRGSRTVGLEQRVAFLSVSVLLLPKVPEPAVGTTCFSLLKGAWFRLGKLLNCDNYF